MLMKAEIDEGTNEGSKLAGNASLWEDCDPDFDLEKNSEFGTSGFCALPGGRRLSYNYQLLGRYTFFWASTEQYTSYYAWFRELHYFDSRVCRRGGHKHSGFSVRCVRD